MIQPERLALFVTVSWALIIAPGPDMLYVIARGMTHGRRAGILSAVGVICGILVHTTAAAFGLALIFQTSAFAFLMVKYIGAAYLVYLGVKAWQDASILSLKTTSSTASAPRLFWQGVLSNLLNPKIAIFFLAFLPQFVDKRNGHVTLQLILLGLTFACFGLCFLLVIGYSSGTLGSWLTDRPQHAKLLNHLAGMTLVGLGVRLALDNRE